MQKYCLSITLLFILWATAADAQKATSTLRIQGDSLISFWGRRVLLSQQGFPQQITTFFTGLADGKDIRLKSGELTFTERSARRISWNVTSMADGLSVYVVGLIKPD